MSSKPSLFCPGCGHSLVLKNLGLVIDKKKIAKQTVVGFDIGCSLLAWDFFDINSLQTHHGRTVPVMVGLKKADQSRIAIAYQGDGGAYAIGWQSLYYAAYRNDPITAIVINNTVYGMTGGQAAPTTLCNEVTATTPQGRICNGDEKPFLGPETLATISHAKSYLARAIVTNPIQMRTFLEKALNNQIKHKSFSLVEILSICPVSWKTGPRQSIDFVEKKMRLVFPVGEIKCHAECTVE